MADVDADAMLAEVREIAEELHPHLRNLPGITLDSELDRDLGLDSLARVELLARIEKRFGAELGEDALANAATPRDVWQALLAASPGNGTRREAAVHDAAEARIESPTTAPTLVDALEWHVREHPDRVHVQLYEEDGSCRPITYGDLYRAASAAAAGLVRAGIGPGDRVAIMLPTGAEYLSSFVGIALCGAVPVPIYPPARLAQIEDHCRRHAGILRNAGVKVLITFAEARALGRLLGSQVPSLTAVLTADRLHGEERAEITVRPSAESIAFLQYTSGSTGNPKGVVLRQADVMASLRVMGEALRATSSDVFVSWLPLYHDMGLIGAWLGSLVYGFVLVLMSPLAFLARPQRWLEAIHRHRGTMSGGPNFAYELCLRRIDDAQLEGLDLSSWRLAFNGAEPVSAATMDRFARRFARCGFDANALTPVYGLAEATLGVAFTPVGRGVRSERVEREALMRDGIAKPSAADDEQALSFVSSGIPIPQFEVRAVDEAGRELPERREGRIEFRGPSTTPGYHDNPEATRTLFHGEWLDSGDRGYLAGGELYLTGRDKELIIRAGRNVYPYELEQAVADIDGVRRGCVAVFGASAAESGTERLVVLAETREKDAGARQRMRRRIEALTLEMLETPADDVVLAPPGSVLKTSSGKIRRGALADLYARGMLGRRQRAVWLQVARLALASLVPHARRALRRVGEIAYAAWMWLVLGVVFAVTWPSVVLAPGIERRWRVTAAAARLLLRLGGAGVRVHGLEHVPASGAFVLVANHSSYLDGLVLAAVMPRRVSFVAKRELERQLVAGRFLARIGCCFVERFDRARGADDARRITERLRGGDPVAFFPEGTLHRMPGLLPFHLGAFVAAAESGVPVLPVTLRGTRSVLRDQSLFPRRGRISVHVSEPVALPAVAPAGEEGAWRRAVALRDAAREEMLRHCNEPDLAGRRELSW